jgi:hypothetical protein
VQVGFSLGGEITELMRVRPVRLNFDSEHEAQQLLPLTACQDRC